MGTAFHRQRRRAPWPAKPIVCRSSRPSSTRRLTRCESNGNPSPRAAGMLKSTRSISRIGFRSWKDTRCFFGCMPRKPLPPPIFRRWFYRTPRVGWQVATTPGRFTVPEPLGEFIGDIPAGRWVQVRIPLAERKSASVYSFQPERLQSLIFHQGRADGAKHVLIVDDIRIDDDHPDSALPPASPATAATRKLSDDELLTMLQEAAFQYYWLASGRNSGMAHENVPGDDRIVATGASGFGIGAFVVAVDRHFITRDEGLARLEKIVDFLERAPRYHGAWSHYMNDLTGQTMALFGMYDNGGDMVETSYLMQGLLTARKYFHVPKPREQAIYRRITKLWEGVEWDWYKETEQSPFIYWHWSPQWGYQIHHPLIGFNESLATYLLAIASPPPPVSADMYYSGWASQHARALEYRQGWSGSSDGKLYGNGNTYYGIKLDVGVGTGGPLFFTQYVFMGFDPHKLHDRFTTSYFDNAPIIA